MTDAQFERVRKLAWNLAGIELADRHRERGLRHVQARGGTAEVQLFGHGDELAQLAQLH